MKPYFVRLSWFWRNSAAVVLAVACFACRDGHGGALEPASLRIALAPHSGDSKIDRQIVKAQEAVRASSNAAPQLERLGWLYVSKARGSHDPGYYKLAE